jgi:hypothetical protein
MTDAVSRTMAETQRTLERMWRRRDRKGKGLWGHLQAILQQLYDPSTGGVQPTSLPYATPAITHGTAAAAGSAASVIRSNATIVTFDATAPANLGAASATGAAAVAARRDHVHLDPTVAHAGEADPHSQYAERANNLSDLQSAATARTNLGIVQGHVIEDEGTPVTQRGTMNFTGAGVSVADAGAKTVVTISGGGSGTDLGWFHVEDYGAVDDNSTDATTAFQDAIDAAAAAGGGTVYAPGQYVIAGALQDTSRSNAQLLLPQLALDTDEQITIRIKGRVAPPQVPSLLGTVVTPDLGSMIRSTLNVGAGGALIGCWGPVGSFGNFSMVHVVFEDIVVRMPSNPVLTALNLYHVVAAELSNVVVDAGSYDIDSVAQPTTTSSYGVLLPANNNGAWTVASNVNVVGFYYGYGIGEHTNADQLGAWACKYAADIGAGNHASHIGRMLVVWCENGLKFTGGDHYIEIAQYDVEHYDGSPSLWLDPIYDVDDASNFGIGTITWHSVLNGVGPDNTFVLNGGANLHTPRVGDTPATATDELAAVSANDTTPGYLNGKLVAGDGIALTENNDGANETLTIAATAVSSGEILTDNTAGTPTPLWDESIDYIYEA